MTGAQITMDQVALRRGDLEMCFDTRFEAGGITAIIGPSGAGKSTLLNLIAGFDLPESGQIRIGEQTVDALGPAERPVCMVFQENNLFSHLSVELNVSLGIHPSLFRRPDDQQQVSEALERVGLSGFEQRMPGSLSGGERQRVAIARALVRRKPVLLLDEPFAALGPRLRRDMLRLISELQAQSGMTTLLVTHQPEDAVDIANDILFINAGKSIASGPADRFLQRDDIDGLRSYLGEDNDRQLGN